MQPLNDDMDELYRKAAENYPLDARGADWNKVMQQLHDADEEDIPVTVKKNDYKKYLWLLMLLPFVFICNRYSSFNDNVPVNTNNKEEKIPPAKTDSKSDEHLNAKTEKQSDKISGTNEKETVTTNTQVETNQNSGRNYTQRINNKQTIHNKRYSQTSSNSAGSLTNNAKDGRNVLTKEAISKNTESSDQKIVDNRRNEQNSVDNKEVAEGNTSGNRDNKTSSNNSRNTISNNLNNNSGNTIAATTAQPPLATKEADSSKTETTNTRVAKSTHSKKGFYAGVVFGPDYSTIKYQRIKKSGYGVGVLVGYQINNHFAIESGGLWDKKNYYSEGEYFNTNKIMLPYNVKIIDVTGSCYMIEIPLNVKYNFKTGKKGNWFVTAGVSSYLMKKEDYTYLYDHNSSTYDVYKAYKNSSRNWFSIMNISAGYEHPLNKNTLLRIEPYVKLPLSGVGIGSLPITSTGLYISITRPVFK